MRAASFVTILAGATLALAFAPPPGSTPRALRTATTKTTTTSTKTSGKVYKVTVDKRPPGIKPPPPIVPKDIEDVGIQVPKLREISPDIPYWYDPRIHNWGNVGFGGTFHAFFAPLFTHLIDRLSYGGMDVRKCVHETFPDGQSVLDLCCGVGFSTAPGATGVDTSREMLSVAALRRPDATFQFGNAETFGEDSSFDIVTVMFGTHEMPQSGRRAVLRNAMRVARKSVVVVDIHPNFKGTLSKKPMAGKSFLSGEPYVLDYLARIDGEIFDAAAWGWTAKRQTLVDCHVAVWRLEKAQELWGI